MTVKKSGQANGLDKLVITNLNQVLDPAAQTIFRQIQTWANNLATANPEAGQVLTAVQRPGTKNGPQAEWQPGGGGGGIKRFYKQRIVGHKNTTGTVRSNLVITESTRSNNGYTAGNPIDLTVGVGKVLGVTITSTTTLQPKFGIFTFQFQLRINTSGLSGTTEPATITAVANYGNATGYGYAVSTVLRKQTTTTPNTWTRFGGSFSRLISKTTATFGTPWIGRTFEVSQVAVGKTNSVISLPIELKVWATVFCLT